MMKKLALLVPAAVGLVGLLAAPALAGSELPPPNDPNVGDVVVRPPGAGPEGLSFTGANVTVWMVLIVGLMLIGFALLVASRRRRLRASP